MSFSNPAGAAREHADRYVADLLRLLGDRDPMVVLAGQAVALRQRVAGQAPGRLQRAEAPGKWSCLDVLQHLADSEIVYAFRLRLILAEDDPVLTGFDQDLWVASARPRLTDVDDILGRLGAWRDGNLRLFRSLAPADWERAGRHSERGRETVERTRRLMAAHDLVHCRQIDRILTGSAD